MEAGVGESVECGACVGWMDGSVGGWMGGWLGWRMWRDAVGWCGGLRTWGVGELGGLWSLWRVIRGWGVGESVAWCV